MRLCHLKTDLIVFMLCCLSGIVLALSFIYIDYLPLDRVFGETGAHIAIWSFWLLWWWGSRRIVVKARVFLDSRFGANCTRVCVTPGNVCRSVHLKLCRKARGGRAALFRHSFKRMSRQRFPGMTQGCARTIGSLSRDARQELLPHARLQHAHQGDASSQRGRIRPRESRPLGEAASGDPGAAAFEGGPAPNRRSSDDPITGPHSPIAPSSPDQTSCQNRGDRVRRGLGTVRRLPICQRIDDQYPPIGSPEVQSTNSSCYRVALRPFFASGMNIWMGWVMHYGTPSSSSGLSIHSTKNGSKSPRLRMTKRNGSSTRYATGVDS